MKEFSYRLLLIAGSVLFTLVLAEIGVRFYEAMTGTSPAALAERLERSRAAQPEQALGRGSLMGLVQASRHEDIVYELKPGLHGTFIGQPFRINEHGMRDRDYKVNKPDGVVRIVALGDSVAFGWGVRQEASFVDVAEALLNEDALTSSILPEVEILNFAVPGYNTAMEVALLEHRALAFDPDLVLLHIVVNDFELPRFLQPPKPVTSMRRSYLWELVASRLGRRRDAEDAPMLLSRELKSLDAAQQDAVRSTYALRSGEVGFRQAMQRLADLARRHDVPVLAVYLAPDGELWQVVDEAVRQHGFTSLHMGPVFNGYLETEGIERTPKGWKQTFWLSRSDAHPNAATHRLMGTALAEALRGLPVMRAETSP